MFRVIETVIIHEKIENATSHSKKAIIKNQGLGRVKTSSKELSGMKMNKAKKTAEKYEEAVGYTSAKDRERRRKRKKRGYPRGKK